MGPTASVWRSWCSPAGMLWRHALIAACTLCVSSLCKTWVALPPFRIPNVLYLPSHACLLHLHRTPYHHPFFRMRMEELVGLPEPAPLEERRVVLYFSRNKGGTKAERSVRAEGAVDGARSAFLRFLRERMHTNAPDCTYAALTSTGTE